LLETTGPQVAEQPKDAVERHDLEPPANRIIILGPKRRHGFLVPKNALTGLLSLALAWLQGGTPRGDLAPRSPAVLSSVALPHAATTLASKGLGAANRLIVACDTLKLRATSACASPLASLCMASRR
jgi:hypothetical protein